MIALIDEVLVALREPVPRSEVEQGWSEENRRIVGRVLERLRGRLEDPRPLRPGEVRPSLSRDIDDLGIGNESRLAERIAEISILSNRLR